MKLGLEKKKSVSASELRALKRKRIHHLSSIRSEERGRIYL